MSHAIRALAMAALALTTVTAAARAEIIVKTDSLPPPSSQQLTGLGNSVTRIANLLTAPVDGNIVGVQILWGSLTGNAAPSQQIAIRVSSSNPNGDPWNPLATLATIGSPVLMDGVINEFRFLDPTTNLIPLSVPITAGTKFFVDLELVPSFADGPDVPGLLLDAGGTQGKNSFKPVNNPLWFPLSLGILGGGDVGIRAIIQPVPEPSTCALALVGVVALLAVRRRKALA